MKLVDDIVYEADCRKITIGGEEFDVGGNPSAEEGEESLDDAKQTVLDVAHSFRLSETSFDKKSYLTHLKGAFGSSSQDLLTEFCRVHEEHQDQARRERRLG
jgi:hypothetical protein